MGNQFVALNALSEMLVLRIARLADKDKKLRTVSMFLKRGNFAAPDEDVKNAADKFITQAGPVVKMRHEQIAHMKLGTLSSYEPKSIEASVISAVIALVEFVNVARQQTVSYRYRVGSQEAEVDLLASLEAGSRVTVK
ncbi:TPA: hypothetical protein NI617_004526 [Pseudomonas aeruginosa]|uniref:hypothetical protein n=1 Tax=Pseudomonas aeruginosa TaxID=287 RepID=UPI001930F306|nr:hypothetical protein [Pseudomonas aeruginosa]MBI9183425.1 hypothetical protein [Pseudomonas aeruginosa]HCF7540545.1 hypothetical protein [Pseudomonas aeruginosa]HCF9365834.1 hypothetical protein [Pseudomonas aeruginosa]HCF9372156.1 hypothetical protein [Pseudomonas aeruginosa]HCF9376241.1 hypothetical protein [Pseudomonas aeruginosa]